TSRAQVFDILGLARPIELQEMQPEEAVAFLLKRTGRDNPNSHEQTAAEQLAKELRYLPLALEQSSAYMLEKHARFQDYLASYRKQRLAVLNRSRPTATDYPESVASTWAINFREVKREPAAADVLRLSAFLGPDHIPLELLTQGASHLGPVLSEVLASAADDPLMVDETLEPLIRYSLIHRNVDTQTYSLHRLVQEVVKDKMDEATRQLWAERAVRMVKKSFPYNENAPWPLSQRYLLHALECVTHIKQHHMAFDEAADLLNSVGVYFWSRGQYEDVEQLFQQAQTIMEQVEGLDTLSEANSLIFLALLYDKQGKDEQAEPLYHCALAIRERKLGAEHPDTKRVRENYLELLEKMKLNTDRDNQQNES
ncbi:MAG: tetratricopeptide repeat protein, partial [Chloroflexi bacterium]